VFHEDGTSRDGTESCFHFRGKPAVDFVLKLGVTGTAIHDGRGVVDDLLIDFGGELLDAEEGKTE